MPKQYFTYIAKCSDESLYTGITDDIVKREKRHNQGIGSNYTKIRTPIKIVYSEKYSTLSEAAKREKQLKGWTKIKKERLILGKNPNPKK